ncbi:hypothetical protein L1885_27965, partial [Streptomyces fuscigenes]|nr:hypothetical protein [Streptomyces fuscigenes]
RSAEPLPAESRPHEDTPGDGPAAPSGPGGRGGPDGRVPGPRSGGAGAPADEEPPRTRPDGLPQRRRRSVRPSLAEGLPAAQPPTNSSRTVGAFARGIRSARQRRNTDERTTDQ